MEVDSLLVRFLLYFILWITMASNLGQKACLKFYKYKLCSNKDISCEFQRIQCGIIENKDVMLGYEQCQQVVEISDTECLTRACSEDFWQCKTGLECIHKTRVCDGDTSKRYNCLDGSDENETFCTSWKCTQGMHKCLNDVKCIENYRICDGQQNCRNSTDEISCTLIHKCNAQQWQCLNSSECIDMSEVCDGKYACSDRTDEGKKLCEHWNCPIGFWKCPEGNCIQNDLVCNGKSNDCQNGSDEHHKLCKSLSCKHGYWRCKGIGRCINRLLVCNGDNDCRDNLMITGDLDYGNQLSSDEAICVNWTCASDMFQCKVRTSCIENTLVMDHKLDCADGSDELYSKIGSYHGNCPAGTWKCHGSQECIHMFRVCDNKPDCVNESDETEILCSSWKCLNFMYRCPSLNRCLMNFTMCDGKVECPGYDESNCTPQCDTERCKCYGNDKMSIICDGVFECYDLCYQITNYLVVSSVGKDFVLGLSQGCLEHTSDERYCESQACMNGYVKCWVYNMKCIPKAGICNGMHDCNQAVFLTDKFSEDELCRMPCSRHLPDHLRKTEMLKHCPDYTAKCIPMDWFCNGVFDCPAGTDEQGCQCSDFGMDECSTGTVDDVDHCVPYEWICAENPVCEVQTTGYSCHDLGGYEVKPGVILDKTKKFTFKLCKNALSEQVCIMIQKFIRSFREATYEYQQHLILKEYGDPLYGLLNKKKALSLNFAFEQNTIFYADHNFTLIMDEVLKISFNNFKFYGKISFNLNVYITTFQFTSCTFFDESLSFFNDQRTKQSSLSIIIQSSSFLKTMLTVFNNNTLRFKLENCNVLLSSLIIRSKEIFMDVINCELSRSCLDVSVVAGKKVPNTISIINSSLISTTNNNLDCFSINFSVPNIVFFLKNSFISVYSLVLYSIANQLTYFLKINISNTVFQDCGRGNFKGAISIVLSSKTGLTNLFSSSVYLENILFQKGITKSILGTTSKGNGGAIAIYNSLPVGINVLIKNSDFIWNEADGLGTAIYLSDGIIAYLTHNKFIASVPPKDQEIISSSGTISIVDCKIAFDTVVHDRDLVFISTAKVGSVSFRISCPMWQGSKLAYLGKFEFRCSICPKLFYIPSIGKFDVLLLKGELVPLIRYNNRTDFIPKCLTCPYGADCSGHRITARPNFWGSWSEDQISFLSCPPGYCCSRDLQGFCSSYDTCYGNRSGVLCGTCNKGYSFSIASENCVPDTSCSSNGWFWVVAVLVALLYMLWYTLKDDIVSIMLLVFSKMYQLMISKIVYVLQIGPQRQYYSFDQLKERNLYVDRGYFGIIAYFVQASFIMKISLDVTSSSDDQSTIKVIENYIIYALNAEIMTASYDLCVIKSLTASSKLLLKLLFFFSIYMMWSFIFLINMFLSKRAYGEKIFGGRDFSSFKLKLISGLIEITKYTYAGIVGILFMAVSCTSFNGDIIWFYDGTIICYEMWQVITGICLSIYSLTFPIYMVYGMKTLEIGLMSCREFLWGFMCPFPGLLYISITSTLQREKSVSKEGEDEIKVKILHSLYGPYRDVRYAKYWESILIIRRLILSGITLLGSSTLRLFLTACFCVLFHVHHYAVQPFKVRSSNMIETVSLLSLVVVALINLLKALLVDTGVTAVGPVLSLFQLLNLIESVQFLLLTAVIILTVIASLALRYSVL